MKKSYLFLISLLVFTGTYSQSFDSSFAGKGYTAVNFVSGNFNNEGAGQVLRKSDGTYLVLFQVNGYAILAHYLANGDGLDLNFGTAGYSQSVFVSQAKAALQPDGLLFSWGVQGWHEPRGGAVARVRATAPPLR